MNIHHFEYLLVLVFSGCIPFTLAFFHPFSPFRGTMKQVFASIVCVAIPFIIWDIYATVQGHWSFSDTYHLPFKIAYLPLEEYLFFIVVPFNCLFVWELYKKYTSWGELWNDLLKPVKSNRL